METYGCQMNAADSELVGGILRDGGYSMTGTPEEADVILVNTCVIRAHAARRIEGRLGVFRTLKRRRPDLVVGVLGCMAGHMRERLAGAGRMVDLVVGPDEYRKLPSLLRGAAAGEKGIAVRLSRVETYEEIEPLRTDGISAWISVMRGCDKFCSFCVVPFTRGRERSRPLAGIVDEVRRLASRGFREVTLLGQNVNSWRDGARDFADLLEAAAAAAPGVRIRFTTSHPRDMSDRLIQTVARHPNICKYVHLPLQSGSDRVLERMNRGYTAAAYRELVDRIRGGIPGVSLTTDLIAGFPGETAGDHAATLELLAEAAFDGAFTFLYSPRPGTKAWDMEDDVSPREKSRRVAEIIALQRRISGERNRALVGTVRRVMVDGPSRKSPLDWAGRTDDNRTVIFPRGAEQPGEETDLMIERANTATLFGRRVRPAGDRHQASSHLPEGA